jgi:hypothetical protein
LEGRKAEKDRFLHIFPAFLPSKESLLRSVSGNRINTELWTLFGVVRWAEQDLFL